MVTGSSQGGKAHGETGESHILGLQLVSGLMLPQGQTQSVSPSQSPHSQRSLLTLPSFSSFHLPFHPHLLPDEEVHPRSASLRLTNTNILTKEMQSASRSPLTSRSFSFFFLKRYALPAAAPINAQRKRGRFSHSSLLTHLHTFSRTCPPICHSEPAGKRVTFVSAAMRASAGTAANKQVPRPADCRALK